MSTPQMSPVPGTAAVADTRATREVLPRQGTLASVSLDLDNQWSYMKTHGDVGWDEYPSYLDAFVDVALPRLRAHGLEITFFIVGQDAALEKNADALRAIAEAGHEIGNHSFRHEPWLHRYSREELVEEITRAEDAIEHATGHRPHGFRGPGFSFSRDTLQVLAERGYRYDASTFPTFLGPLARLYYFWSTRGMSREEREQRSRLFGRFSEGFRPIRPYSISLEERSLVEIPVTTMPIFRVPIHLSYLLYLSRFARWAARSYLAVALSLCRLTRTEPSFLLHPLDFLGGDRVKGLEFFPGMDLATERKLELFDDVVGSLAKRFQLVNMDGHASVLSRRGLTARSVESLE